jgi:flagellar hook-associated protein 2
MPTITSSGAGSGLNVASLVSQLVAAERSTFDTRYTKIDVKLTTEFSALSQLKGSMAAFQTALAGLKDAAAFNQRKTAVASEEYFTATATSAASAGSYGVEVQQLAKAAQLGSSAFVGGPESVVGAGTLNLAMGSRSFDVTLVDSNTTLAGLRDAINAASTNVGVRATIIRDQAGAHLVLTGAVTGQANALRITPTGGLSQFAHTPPSITNNFTQLSPAQDAIVRVSGFEIHDADNTIADAIDGVALTLKKSAPGTTTNLAVETDAAGIRGRVDAFVNAYNALAGQIAKLQSYNAETKAAGPLLGDAMLRNIESQLRRMISEPVAGVNGVYTTLASLGITSSTKGTLSVDQTKYDAALAAAPTALSQVFASPQGLATRIDGFLKSKLATEGEIAVRDAGITSRRKDLTRQREALDARMVVVQARYSKQFNALDSLLANMQSQSSYLAQQLSPRSNGG